LGNVGRHKHEHLILLLIKQHDRCDSIGNELFSKQANLFE